MAKRRYRVLRGFNLPGPGDPVGQRWEVGQSVSEGEISAGDLKALVAAGALEKPKAEAPAVVEPEDEEDEDG